jgi:mannose-6-phosphate isomerase-like protein (cupin superfamily)
MHKLVSNEPETAAALAAMLRELGEPEQILTVESPRPLVVHRVMGQLTLVLGGHGLVSLDGDVKSLQQGDLLILAPGCEHSFAALDGALHLAHWHWPHELLDEDRTVLDEEVAFATPRDKAQRQGDHP